MKAIKFGMIFISSILMTGCVATKKVDLSQLNADNGDLIVISDSRWDGNMVPLGEQGKYCGGKNPNFPEITFDLDKLNAAFNSKITGIRMYAYDVNWSGGHHGKWRYEFDSEASAFTSPKIPSETMKMPKGVKGIATHTAGNRFSSGYYLAPSSCVVGGGHKYFTDITFELASGENITTTFSQGKY